MTREDLCALLQNALNVEVEVVITDNRRSMISFKSLSPSRTQIRIHRMFLNSTPDVQKALISFCRRPTRKNRAVVGQFIEQNSEAIRKKESKKPDPEKLHSKGRVHDLKKMFDRLNLKYFKGKCTAALTWGRAGKPKRKSGRRTIHLGNYSYDTNTIRIHPAMDADYVPEYVVECVLYHEMLHWYIPPKTGGGKRYVHTNLFRQAERAHPLFEKAEAWKVKHLSRLLAG